MYFVTPNAGRPAYYSVRKAAWILGVEPSTVCRAVRCGTLRAAPRHGRLVIPANALARLLGPPVSGNREVTSAESAEGRGNAGGAA